jgi:hypothetical protein
MVVERIPETSLRVDSCRITSFLGGYVEHVKVNPAQSLLWIPKSSGENKNSF